MSDIVSPCPSCISVPESSIGCPPSCRTPTSKLVLVLVDGFSKTRATICWLSGRPSSHAPFGRPILAVFIVLACSSMPLRSWIDVSLIFKKFFMLSNYLRKSFIEKALSLRHLIYSVLHLCLYQKWLTGAKGVQRYLLPALLVTYLNNLHSRHLYFGPYT